MADDNSLKGFDENVIAGGDAAAGGTAAGFFAPGEVGGSALADDQDARDYVRYGRDGIERNVLLSAAAGSGKTRTLVDRIVEKVKNLPEGKHIDSIVVVTFTRAAAAELVGRIEGALLKEINLLRKSGRHDEADRLVNELYLLPKTSIGTIDAFCLELVRKNFTAVKSCTVDSSFVLDKDLATVIRKEAAAKVLEDYYAKAPDTEDGKIIRNILAAYNSLSGDDNFVGDLIKICEFCDSLPDPYAWLEKTAAQFDIGGDVRENLWYRKLKNEYVRVLDESVEHAGTVLNALNNEPEVYANALGGDLAAYIKAFESTMDAVAAEKARVLAEAEAAPALFTTQQFGDDRFTRKPAVKKADDGTEKNRVKVVLTEDLNVAREPVKNFISQLLLKNLIIDGDPKKSEDVFKLGIKELGGYVSLITGIARDIYRKTVEECAVRKSFSFSTVAHFALEVLCKEGTEIGNEDPENLEPSDVAKAYRRTVDEVYVDEYQDTSMLQEFILYMISGINDKANPRNNMIMVGDLKQSIYSFRNARPKLMIDKSRLFESSEGGILLHLSRNFRSRKGVIDGVNEVFSNVMTGEASDIDYKGGSHRLEYGAVKKYRDIPVAGDPTGGRCELIYMSEKTPDNELAVLAAKIRELKENFKVRDVKRDANGDTVYDESGDEVSAQRELRYGDICILVGSNKKISELSAGLKDAGLPIDSKSVEYFFERDEICDILNFVRIIDNPRNDIPLAIVLRSPYFGFTDSDLAEVRASALQAGCAKHTDFWEELAVSANSDDPAFERIADKAKDAVTTVTSLRELAENITVSSFVWKLINFRDYYKNADDIAKGNLRKFLTFAYPFDKGVFGGLYGFVRSMDRTVAMDSDSSKKAYEREKSYTVVSEAPDKIKIMTTHKSKGLEFPVVFYMDTNTAKRNHGIPSCTCDEDLGIGLNFQYEDGGIYKKLGKSAPNILMNYVRGCEERKEMQRVVYVALTRAQEKLIVIGSPQNKDEVKTNLALMADGAGQKVTTASIKYQKTPFGTVLLGIDRKNGSAWVREVTDGDKVRELIEKLRPAEAETAAPDEAETPELKPEEPPMLPPQENEQAGDIANAPAGDVDLITEVLETANAGAMPVKISVSALKRYASDGAEAGDDANVFKIEAKEFPSKFGNSFGAPAGPETAADDTARGARFGVIMHRLMKYLVEDRANWPARDDEEVAAYVSAAVAALRKAEVFSDEEAKLVSRRMAANFLLSDRADEVRRADKARCEVPFTYRVDVKKYLPFAKQAGAVSEAAEADGAENIGDSDAPNIKSSLKERNTIALQGVIDLYYKIGTRIVVLDFKTDNLERMTGGKTLEAYLLQIRCYRDALAEISGEKPDESLLFFLRSGEEVKLEESPRG